LKELLQEKIENFGDPITSTQWVASWSHEREGIKKLVSEEYFLNKGRGSPLFLTLCKISVAIVFGLENLTFLAKIYFLFLNVPRGGGGSPGFGNIPKKQFFWRLPKGEKEEKSQIGHSVVNFKRIGQALPE